MSAVARRSRRGRRRARRSSCGAICRAADLDRYVHAHPAATGYHLSGWRGVIERAFGHETRCLAADVARRQVAGVLPLVFFNSRLFGRFTVSMPFLNYGGVVADTRRGAAGAGGRAPSPKPRARRGSHLELRHTGAALRGPRAQAAQGRDAAGARSPTADRQWERLDRKVRNQVRKGEKSQLTVVHGGAELVDEFYTVFAHNMRDLGTPVYARAFFAEVLRTFPDTARVFVVRHEGTAGGGVDRLLAPLDDRGAVGLGAARVEPAVRQRAPLLAHAEVRGRARLRRVRLRPLDAQRGHVSLQAPVGRRAAASWSGSTGTRPARRRPTSTRRIPSSISPSGCGSGCRCRSPRRSDRTWSGTSRRPCVTLLLVSVLVLAYVVVGYPLLLRLLVAVRGAAAACARATSRRR